MGFYCIFCEEQPCYLSYLCADCRSLKHTKLLYKERFNEVIKNVLLRTPEKQVYKEKEEMKKDIEEKQKAVTRSQKKTSA